MPQVDPGKFIDLTGETIKCDALNIGGSTMDGSDLTAFAALAADITASAAEINYNDITTLGTGAASKAVVLDTGDDYTWPATGVLTYGVLRDGPNTTTITASGAELNLIDGSLAGTAVASKALVLGATKNVDTLVIADGGLYLGAGAGTSVTATAAELNLIDTSIAGTSVASKALVLGANKNVDVFVVADGGFYLGSGAGTAVGATAAELNLNDISAHTETIAEGGVVSVTKRVTKLTQTTTGAITLAAPSATMLGEVKVITQVDGGTDAVTLSLANVLGGSAATTASFNATNETLTLVAGVTKWFVIGEAGVTLS